MDQSADEIMDWAEGWLRAADGQGGDGLHLKADFAFQGLTDKIMKTRAALLLLVCLGTVAKGAKQC